MSAVTSTATTSQKESGSCSVLRREENNYESIVNTKEAMGTEDNAYDVVKQERQTREAEELLKYLYRTMDKIRHQNHVYNDTRAEEWTSDNDDFECDDYYLEYETDYDLAGRQKQALNGRRRAKRNRTPSKEQKFTSFCRKHQTPENIRFEKGKKDATCVKYNRCTRQMSRDSNRRDHNERRKANIERKLEKLGVKRRGIGDRNAGVSHEQSEKFELRKENVPEEMENMLDFLMALQTREVSPEDYDFLLKLDDLIPKKTISGEGLRRLEKDVVVADGTHVYDEVCGICMENYETGQIRKILPCSHAFHSNCIDQWLGQSSTKCPMDGQEI